jgi:acetyltransferase-like isoleucine patch superfamily enzyme
MLRKLKTFILYVVSFHIVRILCDIFLPNFHGANIARGFLLGFFFKSCGKRFAVASGCTFNSVWNLVVEEDVYIAHNCWINAAGGLHIGAGVILSPNVVVATTAHDRVDSRVSLRKSKQSPITIGRGAWVASNAVVTRGAVIGDGSVVGACSVVVGEVAPNSFYCGNPAEFIKSIS